MDNFNLVYIDDSPEPQLSRYFDKEFHSDDYEITYVEIRFDPKEGYESLLSNPKVQCANIIFIDSLLFENRTANNGKFTGEEFKLVLKKIFPFIEVIVITQNGVGFEIHKIAKYDSKDNTITASEYYARELPKYIDGAVENIRQYWKLADMVRRNKSWDEVLKDKIMATLKGTNTYDKLTKEDVDTLVNVFKEIEDKING